MPELQTRDLEYLRVSQAVREFPVSRAWINEQVRLRRLRAFKPSPMVVLVRRADIVALIESSEVAQAQPA